MAALKGGRSQSFLPAHMDQMLLRSSGQETEGAMKEPSAAPQAGLDVLRHVLAWSSYLCSCAISPEAAGSFGSSALNQVLTCCDPRLGLPDLYLFSWKGPENAENLLTVSSFPVFQSHAGTRTAGWF